MLIFVERNICGNKLKLLNVLKVMNVCQQRNGTDGIRKELF